MLCSRKSEHQKVGTKGRKPGRGKGLSLSRLPLQQALPEWGSGNLASRSASEASWYCALTEQLNLSFSTRYLGKDTIN